jgi:hypothetical protein
MPLKLMYITNNPKIAKIAESSGVDRIFVDLEYIGKKERQGGLDTVQNKHTIDDISLIKHSLTTSEVLCRINPIHNFSSEYCSSKEEIDSAIAAGADILMLPYFKSAEEVQTFVQTVAGRAKTMPLVETPEAVEAIDDILSIDGIDEIYIGLNDLSLGYEKKFMFELLSDGTVEELSLKFRKKNIPFGFGGIAAIGKGMLSSERIITEHYRLGSTCAILSRSFCNLDKVDINSVLDIFMNGVKEIRDFEKPIMVYSDFFFNNKKLLDETVKHICEGIY